MSTNTLDLFKFKEYVLQSTETNVILWRRFFFSIRKQSFAESDSRELKI
jgi:hypothetical protein